MDKKLFPFCVVLLGSCFIVLTEGGCIDVNNAIVKKSEWGGQAGRPLDDQSVPVKYAIIHHTVTGKCDTKATCSAKVQGIQNHHINVLKWSEIGYNFLIGNDGNVYEGAGWHKIGAHTRGYNSKSLGIAFIGNFDEELPSASALTAAKKLLRCGVRMEELDRNYQLLAARQVSQTISPGTELYAEIQDWRNWAAHPS